jgi:hypothetical protein
MWGQVLLVQVVLGLAVVLKRLAHRLRLPLRLVLVGSFLAGLLRPESPVLVALQVIRACSPCPIVALH